MNVPTLIRAIDALDDEQMLEVLESIRENMSKAEIHPAEIERMNERIREFETHLRRPE